MENSEYWHKILKNDFMKIYTNRSILQLHITISPIKLSRFHHCLRYQCGNCCGEWKKRNRRNKYRIRKENGNLWNFSTLKHDCCSWILSHRTAAMSRRRHCPKWFRLVTPMFSMKVKLINSRKISIRSPFGTLFWQYLPRE